MRATSDYHTLVTYTVNVSPKVWDGYTILSATDCYVRVNGNPVGGSQNRFPKVLQTGDVVQVIHNLDAEHASSIRVLSSNDAQPSPIPEDGTTGQVITRMLEGYGWADPAGLLISGEDYTGYSTREVRIVGATIDQAEEGGPVTVYLAATDPGGGGSASGGTGGATDANLGGSVAAPLYAARDNTDRPYNPCPVVDTEAATLVIPASSQERTLEVSGWLTHTGSHPVRVHLALDSAWAYPGPDNSILSQSGETQWFATCPPSSVVVPGDNQPHTLRLLFNAAQSDTGITIKATQLLAR